MKEAEKDRQRAREAFTQLDANADQLLVVNLCNIFTPMRSVNEQPIWQIQLAWLLHIIHHKGRCCPNSEG